MAGEKLVLIDGHSILTRAFFGVPDLTDAMGRHTNAVYGFLNILFKILEEEQAQYLCVAFDMSAPTFRHKMFQEYKGTRKPMPAELHEQVPLIREVLEAMHIKVVSLEGYEADDLLGTLAKRAQKASMNVTVVSGDRDLLQLATEKILIRIPKTKKGSTEIENYYADDIKALYGVSPLEFIDMKGLMGDTSDNIPGVKSVGEKTAAKLIMQYHSIENIYAHIDEVKPERIKNALIQDEESAKMSKVLATISLDAPIEVDFSECTIQDMYNQESFAKIKALGFKSMLSRFDAGAAEHDESFRPLENSRHITTREALDELYAHLKDIDDTVGYVHCIKDDFHLSLVALSIGEELFFVETGDALSSADLKEILVWLYNGKKKVALFELKSILKDVPLELGDFIIYDCALMAYLLNPLQDTYDYEYILSKYAGIQTPGQAEILGKTPLHEADSDRLYKILASQGKTAARTGEIMRQALEESGMWKLYEEIEYPLVFVLDDMEKEGVRINEQGLKQYGEALTVGIAGIEQEIYDETKENFNINSPKQLGIVLFEKMGLPGGKKTKTGYSTSAEVLEKLAPDYPVVSKILEYRQLTKLKSTYADGLRAFVSADGRIHGTFNQTITATGRISSTDPNLQNIPIRMELGRKIREVFIPREGCIFVDADYSQIELRLLAHMSGDKNLIEAYNSEQDIHKITASQVFHVPLEEVTPQIRRNAKAVNFGIVYGISSFGLSQDLSISKKEAGEYIQKYFETYPDVKRFLDDTVANAKKDGYTVTLFGRRRPIPELKSSNFMQRSFGERAAMNSAVQGTAADIMKIAMINVYRRLKKEGLRSKIILQVHDEILIETWAEEAEQVKKVVAEEMMGAAKLSVGLSVGMESGKNWLEAH